MSKERMFILGLFVGVAALVLLVASAIALEYTAYDYWIPISVAMVVTNALAAIAGIMCGMSIE